MQKCNQVRNQNITVTIYKSIPFQFHQRREEFHYHSLPMHKLTPYGLWRQLEHIHGTDWCVQKCCCLSLWNVNLKLVVNFLNHWYHLNNHLPLHHLTLIAEQVRLQDPIWKPPLQGHQRQQYCSKMHDTIKGSEDDFDVIWYYTSRQYVLSYWIQKLLSRTNWQEPFIHAFKIQEKIEKEITFFSAAARQVT